MSRFRWWYWVGVMLVFGLAVAVQNPGVGIDEHSLGAALAQLAVIAEICAGFQKSPPHQQPSNLKSDKRLDVWSLTTSPNCWFGSWLRPKVGKSCLI